MSTTSSSYLNSLLITLTCFIAVASIAQSTTSISLHSQVDRVQPMTGIVFWADNASDLATLGNKTQLEFSYLIYSDVIEQENTYDWTTVDNLLAAAETHSRQVVLRFRYTYPGESQRSVPLYITQESGYTTHVVQVEGSNTYIPDWTSQDLQDFTLEFYTKFAERYDNDPRLAFVQLGFGSYSEYHLYDGPSNPVGTYFPSKSFQTDFLSHVDTLFQETQWSLSIDAASSSYSPISQDQSLLDLGYGLFDDSFLHEHHSENDNEYNRASWLSFGSDRSRDRVAGGELNYYSNYDQEHVLDPNTGPWGTSYESLSNTYNITYMIGNDQLSYQTTERIEEAGMANGYRFEVTRYETDGFSTTVTIKNNGIAPIYYDAYPSINGSQSSTSLKGLIPGDSLIMNINAVAVGEDLTIACDRLVSGQVIQFDANLDTITGIDDHESSSHSIYPTIVNNRLTVDLTVNSKLMIINSKGEIIIQDELEKGQTHINVEHLSEGSYHLILESPQGNEQGSFVKL